MRPYGPIWPSVVRDTIAHQAVPAQTAGAATLTSTSFVETGQSLPLVFLSHRNGEPAVVTLIETIGQRLDSIGLETWVDFDRLQPGARWRDEIYKWLGVCHAGIVIVSPEALAPDSVWVEREASILSWRKVLDPDFTLIPILLPGVTVAQLRDDVRFRDLGLDDLQLIQHTSLEATCKALHDGLQHLTCPAHTPLEELAEQIQVLLEPMSGQLIEGALRRCDPTPARQAYEGNPRRSLALSLLHSPLSKAVEALEFLATRVAVASSVDRILEIIAPGWVDLAAARWLAFCASASAPRPAAVINAKSRFAADMYVRRASCRPPKTMWHVVSVTGTVGELAFEDLAVEIQQALLDNFAAHLSTDPLDPAPEVQLPRVLKTLENKRRPVIVVLRIPVSVAELMPRLQDRFPYITFLFLSGDTLPDATQCPEMLVRRIEPALALGREDEAMSEYQAARISLRAGVQP